MARREEEREEEENKDTGGKHLRPHGDNKDGRREGGRAICGLLAWTFHKVSKSALSSSLSLFSSSLPLSLSPSYHLSVVHNLPHYRGSGVTSMEYPSELGGTLLLLF